jgi:putative protease
MTNGRPGIIPGSRANRLFSNLWKTPRSVFQWLENTEPDFPISAHTAREVDNAAFALHNGSMSATRNSNAGARPPELMAPAGNLEAGYAALHFGADAVYLGLQKFSARADAENFSLEDLDRLTAYAHALTPRRKVFVALNTLVLQQELREVIAAMADAAEIGVDALIVQDLGVFRIARRYFPELRLHASTQMAVHNLEGAMALQELGFHRITLARELTLEEIRDISNRLRTETEFFAHGALCYSYSGLCLISSLLMGRSGNRGRCAYLCRDRFQTPQDESGRFLFSMKDLATADHMEELAASGVASLKIEGRKKSPLYVAATVNYYRRLLDRRISPTEQRRFESDIQTIFSRPWTTLHLNSPAYAEVTDPAFVGHRGARTGRVETIVTRGRTHWLRFTTERDLERFDGLQLELAGLDKPYGFSVEELMVCRGPRGRSQRCFEARAGTRVEVLLPPNHPPIPKGAVLYCSSAQAVKRRYRYEKPKPDAFRIRHEAEVTLRLTHNGAAAIATCGNATAHERIEMALKPARQADALTQAASQAFEKTGGTRFRLRSLRLENPGGLFVPVSVLNDLRRRVLDGLEKARAEEHARRVSAIVQAEAEPARRVPSRVAGPKWSVKISDPACLDGFGASDRAQVEEVVLDIGAVEAATLPAVLQSLSEAWSRERIRLALPLVTRSWERNELRTKIVLARDMGFDRWEAAHFSAWAFLGRSANAPAPDDPALELSSDWSVYVLNRAAARQVLDMGAGGFVLSPEDTRENLSALLSEFTHRATVILYQDTPLFISENCIRPGALGSPGCPSVSRCAPRPLSLRSSHGDRLLVETRRCRTFVLGENPLSWSQFLDDLRTAGGVRFRIDLSWRPYSPENALRIWRAATAGQPIPHTHIGNFQRGLL